MGKKISQLPSGTAISGPELFPAVQSGTTKKFTLATLMSWIVGVITPTSIGAQSKITASGILKGDGAGGVSAATAGTDYGTYSKPSGGIPSSDMASGVQTSLGKADTAYQKPSGGIPASDLASGVIPTVPSASSTNPLEDGTVSPGSSSDYARGDHVHPHDSIKANQAQLATVETGSTASRAYAVGEYFCWQGTLYRATAAISSGGTFTPGTNCEAVVVGDFMYSHEYPNERWFALRAGQKLTIHIGGTTSASGLSNLLMAFSSNVSTLNGGLAYLKIIDYRLNMHSLNFLFGALPTNIAMSDAAGEMTFTNTTTGNAVCQINVIMLGSLSKNITFSVT